MAWAAVAALIIWAIFVSAVVPGVYAVAGNEFKTKVNSSIIPPNLVAIFEPVTGAKDVIVGGFAKYEKPVPDIIGSSRVAVVKALQCGCRCLAPDHRLFCVGANESWGVPSWPAAKVQFLPHNFIVAIASYNQMFSFSCAVATPCIKPFDKDIVPKWFRSSVQIFKKDKSARIGLHGIRLAVQLDDSFVSLRPSLLQFPPLEASDYGAYHGRRNESAGPPDKLTGPIPKVWIAYMYGVGCVTLLWCAWCCLGKVIFYAPGRKPQRWDYAKRMIWFVVACIFVFHAISFLSYDHLRPIFQP
ncbi:hypothetical protein [Acidisphaera sp. S103]|uniref:hypothetical protein n=1 Tax=Acidisphaera sp. S103 TaxID=1747223 RepID=UPI00131D768B|nr:hypothetical protein [Acidisphaera sp. S103]